MKNLRIIIITGLSGSGKSTALRALEDIGFFCIDNLPILLLPKLLEIQANATNEISKTALVMDIRGRDFLENYKEVIADIKRKGSNVEILFLEATNDAILHRFSETKRTHPLSDKKPVRDSIILEREKLSGLKEMADKIIDTTDYNVHRLKKHIQQYYRILLTSKQVTINLISFGYRFGLPPEADIVLDVRFLPNPYWVEDLKNYDGNDKKVEDYVLKCDEAKTFLLELFKLVDLLTPLYEKEGKSYLTIAMGCTGGMHRSVVIVNQLAHFFKSRDYVVNVNHRDVKVSAQR